jgi:UDP-N-acetylglucosamine--N-acetylmuramyl-(pentapeptide) pyrophosphoryl-undecaprenol N-acetylglucosamine transferase
VYPALSILQALGNKFEETLWVGGEGGMEAGLVNRQGIPFRTIPAAGLHGVGLRSIPGNVMKLAKGYFSSVRILREYKPDVLLFTGGYIAAPMALAGRKIPTMLYVPDIEPGKALSYLAKFADVITLTAPASRQFFSPAKKMVVTGYPTRADLQKLDKKTARKQMGLDANLSTLLIVGGSKGARLINQAVVNLLPQLLVKMQVIHLTGELDWDDLKGNAETLPADLRKYYHPFPYLHEEMAAAFSSADVVLSRAGASTLGELPYYGIPAILVPYPFAWRYQKVNADYLAEKGAALVIENAKLEASLLSALDGILQDESKHRSMAEAMRSLAHPQAAAQIASLVYELSERKGRS